MKTTALPQKKNHAACETGPQAAQVVHFLPVQEAQETRAQPLGREDPPEGKMATFQYSCLESSVHRGAWRPTVHAVRVGHHWATEHTHTTAACGTVYTKRVATTPLKSRAEAWNPSNGEFRRMPHKTTKVKWQKQGERDDGGVETRKQKVNGDGETVCQ